MPVALICHLQRIEPLCPMPAPGAAAPVDWSFSLNLSTSLTEAPTNNALLPYLTPWGWRGLFQTLPHPAPGPVLLVVGVLDSGTGVFTPMNGGAPINGTIIPLPDTDQPHDSEMFKKLTDILSNRTLQPPLGTGDRDPVWIPNEPEPINAKFWPHLQGHLGSLAYPLSQWLNLSLCFKATLPAGVVTALANLTANQQVLFFAAPTIEIPIGAATETWQPVPAGPVIVVDPKNPKLMVDSSTTWNMNGQSSVGGAPTVSTVLAHVQAVAVGIPANVPARLVPLQTQWVQRNGTGWSGARWQSTLTHSLTSTFDLVSRLVDAVRLDSTTAHSFQPGNIHDLTLAALALLRDLGDAGLRPLGNSRGLIDDELDRLSKSSDTNKDAYLRGLKRSFRAAVQWSDHLTVLVPPASADKKRGPGDVNNWYWQLVAAAPRAKDLIDRLLALPATATAPAPAAPAVADAVVLLDQLQSIFGSDSVVATLLTNAWQNAVPVQPTPVELPTNAALSFAPLTTDADRPIGGTSAFTLDANNQLKAVPGTGYVTAAYRFVPSQKLAHLYHTLSVRLRYAKAAASPFTILTAFRIGAFNASDFHANPNDWTVIGRRLTEGSPEPENTSLTLDLDPATLIPGDTPLITVVFHYEPAAAGTITAIWEAIEIRPVIDFFTTYDRGTNETDALTIVNGTEWWFTVPQIDLSTLAAGKSATFQVTVPTDRASGTPLFTVQTTFQPGAAGGDFQFAWLATGKTPVPISAPAITAAAYRANLNLRIKLAPAATGWNATLGYLDVTTPPTWKDLAPTFRVDPIVGGAARARLRVMDCMTTDTIASLRFQMPSALDILGTPDPTLVAAWFPPTPDNKPLLFWESAQAMTDNLDQRLPRSRLGEALVTVALPDLLKAIISSDPKKQIEQMRDALSISLLNYCDTRFGKNVSTPWARCFPLAPPGSLAANADKLYKLITDAIRNYATSFVDAKIGDRYVTGNVDGDGLAPDVLTTRPQPLVIDFDLPGHSATDNGELELLNQISGVALFLTSARTNSFRCASIAKIELYENDAPLTNHLTLDNVLIPFRPSYINEQRIATLSYDNVPLPLNARDNQLHPNPPLKMNDDRTPIQRGYQLVYKPANEAFAKPPLLRFGEIYSSAIALLTTGGALPKELQDPLHPAKLKDFTGAADPSPASAQMKLRYLRHVGISHPRCYDVVKPNSPLPQIPSRAKPLAREMRRECYSGELGTSPLWFDFLSQSGTAVPVIVPWTLEVTDISLAALGDATAVNLYATTDTNTFNATNPATYLFKLTIVRNFDAAKLFAKLTLSTDGGIAADIDLHQSALFDLVFDFSVAGHLTPRIRETAFDKYRDIFQALPIPANPASVVFGIVLTAPAGNNLGTFSCSVPVLNTNLKPGQYSGQRRLPTVSVGKAPLPDPFNKSVPLVLLTPASPNGGATLSAWDGTASVQLNFGKPSADFEVWWRTYRGPSLQVESALRINVLAEISDRRNRAAASTQPKNQQPDVDTWVDDPAVEGELVFEAIPLRLSVFDATNLLIEATPSKAPSGDKLGDLRDGTVEFEVHENSDLLQASTTIRKVLDGTVTNKVTMTIYPGEVWEVRVYSKVSQARFEDPNIKSLAPALKVGARPFTGKDLNPSYLVAPHCFLVEGADDVSTAQALILTSGSVETSTYKAWLKDLNIDFVVNDPTTITAQYLAQFDLIVVLPAPPGPQVAAWLKSLSDLVKPLAVPVVVLGAAEAEALGLGTSQAAADRHVTLNDANAGQSLETEHLAGDYLNASLPDLIWSAPALANVPAASLIAADSAVPASALVAATDRLQPLATAATDLAAERRVACFLISSSLTTVTAGDNPNVSERFFKGAIRWAARWPLAERLWESMSPMWIDDARRIDFVLDRTRTPSFDLLSTFEARHQAWRWQGTPVTCFPFELKDPKLIDRLSDDALADPEVAAAPLLWDTEGFGRRADTDATSISPIFPLRPLSWKPVDSRQLASDLRAAYFRYTIVATSRYAGYAPVATIAAAHFANPNALTFDQMDAWRRVLAPCKLGPPVPKPVLKLVLPLTQTSKVADARSTCPGLLAIFSETWFQKAGPAETVRAEIELCSYTPAGGTPRDFAQYGSDPLESAATITPQTAISQYTPALVTSGPTGTTFDGAAGEALYTKSWFIVEALPLPGQNNFFEWNFAKLRFRRGVAAEASASPLAPVADFAKTVAFDVTSSFSRGGSQGSRPRAIMLSNGSNQITSITLSYPNDSLVSATITDPKGLTTTASFIAYSQITVKFEFRSFGTTVKGQPTSTWLITPYVGGERTRWHPLDPFVWSDVLPTPVLLPTLAVRSQQNTTSAPACKCTPILESDPTDSVWVQILPDSNMTKIQPADRSDTTQRIAVDQLRIQRWPSAQPTALRIRCVDDGNVDVALGRDQPQKDGHSSFVRAIALTARVTDFRGQPSERFIGIYAGDYSAPTLPGAILQFVPLDSGYPTAPGLGPSTTPSSPPSEVPPPSTLLARVVTLQWRTDAGGRARDNIQKVWTELFAQPREFGKGEDEKGRIISVSAPFGEL